MTFKFYQTRSNAIKQQQTSCANGKMFGHQARLMVVVAKHFPFVQALRIVLECNSSGKRIPQFGTTKICTKGKAKLKTHFTLRNSG